jgi:hypothetical protein
MILCIHLVLKPPGNHIPPNKPKIAWRQSLGKDYGKIFSKPLGMLANLESINLAVHVRNKPVDLC